MHTYLRKYPQQIWVSLSIFSLVAVTTSLGIVAFLSADQAFRPKRVISAGFDPITKFETRTVNQIADAINPDELVLGVVVNGEARAYPINMLTGPSREIINDKLGEKKIGATW